MWWMVMTVCSMPLCILFSAVSLRLFFYVSVVMLPLLFIPSFEIVYWSLDYSGCWCELF